MYCPQCSHQETKVLDSRLVEEWHAVRRRRQCDVCQYRFTTFERMTIANLFVEKKDGSIEYYDRNKLIKSIMLACAKRPIDITSIEHMVRSLETKWMGQSTITTKEIGDDVLPWLKELDDVAYIRFASVYRDFATVQDFIKACSSASFHRLHPLDS